VGIGLANDVRSNCERSRQPAVLCDHVASAGGAFASVTLVIDTQDISSERYTELPVGEESETHATGRLTLFRDGVITLVVLLLVFAAFDDITTDNATALPVEYSLLIACGAWLLSAARGFLAISDPIPHS